MTLIRELLERCAAPEEFIVGVSQNSENVHESADDREPAAASD